MKLKFIIFISIALLLWNCAGPIEEKGNIYGVVTEYSSAEPMRAAGISLYTIEDDFDVNMSRIKRTSLLLKTVTYDDGHYEFNDIIPGIYHLSVEMEGYDYEETDVTVEGGRTARADMQMKHTDVGITVKTNSPTIGSNIATFLAEYSYQYTKNAPTEYGFVYGINQNPTKEKDILIKGTKLSTSGGWSSFKAEAKDLKKGAYYVRAYAINSLGTAYGENMSFEISGNPSVVTLDVTNIQDYTATLNGKIEYPGDPVYSEKGFVYSSSYSSPTLDDPESATKKVSVSGNSDDFSKNIDGLNKNTKYYVRAYVINSNSTIYGETVSFTATSDRPYVIVDAIAVQKSDITSGTTLTEASSLCKNSRVAGYSDWRLPSLGELSLLYTNRNTIGGFYSAFYWSSSWNGACPWTIDFIDGQQYGNRNKDNRYRARCVRTL